MPFQPGNQLGKLAIGKHTKPVSDETRQKMSLAKKGKMPKNLAMINANKSGEGNPMFGYKYTPEQLQERSRISLDMWMKNPDRKVKARESFSGENNPNYGKDMSEEKAPNWAGEEVGYHGVHKWIARWKGKPKMCEMCGSTSKRKYEWANIDHKYRRVLEDYIRLCTSCHRKYDYENN